MKKILFCSLLFLISQPLLATSIVVLITENYIVIGADSKRMIIDAEKNLTVNETVCKIRKVNNFCFAVAGLVASKSTSFSADAIINFHLRNTTNINKALRGIKQDIKRALRAELVHQKQHQPRQYRKTLELKDHILEVVIISMNNNVPQAHVVGFELENEEKTIIKDYEATCKGSCAKNGTQFFFLGEYSGMEKYLNTEQDASDPVSLVRQLIISQSKITPSSVGAPISLAMVSTNGLEWISSYCEN